MVQLPAVPPFGSARVLVVDDDSAVRSGIRRCLERSGYRVLEAADGMNGVRLALSEQPALVVLDVAMPGKDGIEVAAELRRRGNATPILMLSGRDEVRERVAGLTAGADDYLGKPFGAQELVARVNALLRREAWHAPQRRILRFGPVEVDLGRRVATRAGAPVPLTQTEFAILAFLSAHLDVPVSRAFLLGAVWGYTYLPDTRTVDTHIWRLRKKLGDEGGNPRWIKPVRGEGYMLTGCVPEAPR